MTNNNNPQAGISLISWLATQQWFSIQELRLFIFGILISILAKGISAFALAYAIDDILWINFSFEGSLLKETSLADGRYILPILVECLYQLGIEGTKAYTLSAFCMMTALVLCAQLSCRIWRIEKDWLLSLIVILLVALHPYQVDIFTWKTLMLPASIPFILTMLGLWAVVFLPRYGFILGTLAIIVSLAIYQLAITFALVTVCFSIILTIIQPTKTLAEKWAERKITQQVLAMGLALICYLIIFVLIRWIFPPTDIFDRANILSNINTHTLSENILYLIDLLLFHNSLFTPLMDYGLILLTVIFIILLVKSIDTNHSIPKIRLLALGLATLALVGAWGACTGFAILASFKGVISVRVMFAFSLMWAGIVVVSLLLIQNKILYRLVVGIVAVLSISFTAINNQVLSDQLRANQRDIELSNRIVSDIEKLDGFHRIINVAVIGTTNSSLRGLRTALDLSQPKQSQLAVVTSIFANTYGDQFRTLLLNEATGSNFGPNLTPEEKKIAAPYCQYARNYIGVFFPRKGGIVRDNSLGIVCL